jgi:hypothetical protein
MERAEMAARTRWTTDPVHPSLHTVAKIGLHLSKKWRNTVVDGEESMREGVRKDQGTRAARTNLQ